MRGGCLVSGGELPYGARVPANLRFMACPKKQYCSKKIFHDAQVLDLDFSKWSKYVRIVAMSAFLEGDDEFHAIFNVDFHGVKSFGWESRHLHVELPENDHCQWVVFDYDIDEVSSGFRVELKNSSGPEPVVNIVCENISFSRMNIRDIEIVFPEWGIAFAPPLLRGDVQTLSKLIRSRL